MGMMAGWIVSVTTVTHYKGYGLATVRHVETRKATVLDLHFTIRGARGFEPFMPPLGMAGPCGTRVDPSRSAFAHTLLALKDYAARWGRNPLGVERVVRGRKGRSCA
jgi:hypothetical protein